MFHDDRRWCVRPVGTPEALASQVTRRTWPACAAFEIAGYLFLNDSLPQDGSTDFAVVKCPTAPGGRVVQVASLTLGFCDDASALDHIRRVLAGGYDAPATAYAVDPQLETAAGHSARGCPFCS